MYRVLVTGGAGYIGSALISQLVQIENITEIIIYDNLSHGRRETFLQSSFVGAEKLSFVFGELLDTRKLKKQLQNIDYVIHLAAKVTTPFADGNAHSFEQVNHWGTAELSYLLEDLDIKGVLYVSSASVYGLQDGICEKDTPPNPKSWYGQSKLRGEKMLERLRHQFPVTILRCANVYGIAPNTRFDAVINRFVFEGHFQRRLMIEGTGKQERPFVHIQNIVRTIANITEQTLNGSQLWNDHFHVVQHNSSVISIANALRETYDDLEMIFVEQDMPRHRLTVSIDEKINAFFQETSLKEELQAMIARFAF